MILESPLLIPQTDQQIAGTDPGKGGHTQIVQMLTKNLFHAETHMFHCFMSVGPTSILQRPYIQSFDDWTKIAQNYLRMALCATHLPCIVETAF